MTRDNEILVKQRILEKDNEKKIIFILKQRILEKESKRKMKYLY